MTNPNDIRRDLTFSATLHGQALDFVTTWGIFSPKAIDEGTQLLADLLEIAPDAACLDLGCGYGPLGVTMGKLAPRGSVVMVDKDFVAVDYAARNATLNGLTGASAYLSNGFSAVPDDARFDVIVSNIPAKIGSELLTIFLQDAKRYLKPGGQIYVVTISGLKDYMKRNLNETFGNYEKLKQSRTYTAARATK